MNERMQEVWHRLTQVLSEPVEAFRALRERPLILWSLIIVVLSELAMNLLSVEVDEAGMLGFAQAPPESEPSALQMIMNPLVTAGVFWIGTLIVYFVGRMFGGSGSHRGLLSCMGFASLPGILQAPAFLLGRSLGILSVAAIGQIAFAVWMIVLNVLAIRESLEISTARSVGVFLIGGVATVAVVILLAALFGFLLFPFAALA